MAPSTPPPPSREELAAFTIASVVSSVMSPIASSRVALEPIRYRTLCAIYLSVSASTPGSFLPSRNSSEAPPPVEMCVISSADDRNSAAVSGNRFCDFHGSLGERRDFKHAHGAVPNHRLGAGDLLAVSRNR